MNLRLEPVDATLGAVVHDVDLRSDDPDLDVVRSLRGNEGWHHDSTHMPVRAKGAVFSAEIVPATGGATGWADMRAAYDALEPAFAARLATLAACHSLRYSQGRAGLLPTPKPDGSYSMYGYHDLETPVRPLVTPHPVTGRPNLVIGRHAHDVVDMATGEGVENSEELLDRLNDEACREPRVHFHSWTPGDTVIWDNRRLMHRGTPFEMTEPRRMWHTRIAGHPTDDAALNHRPESRSHGAAAGSRPLG